ncbi:hypothetical protein R3P38DRAFT_2553906 [Favolaschia claudopus]|uniref:CxC1-like cysteine cluster associated with KDZ transposases domain-containing protein n=1 Tax=Favolaschia claudopus TaxID=2862362 RepID=A0AAW0ADM2_9AGAR
MLKLSKKQRHAAATSTPDYTLHDGPRAHDIRKKIPPLLDRPDVLLPGNKTLKQPRLPPLLSRLCAVEPPSRSEHAETPPVSEELAHDEFAADAAQEPDIVHMPHSPVGQKFRHQRKRATQWARWQTDILPMLIPHFARFLSQTKSLRNMERLQVDVPRPCECNQVSLKVAIVRFHCIDDVRIHVCKCNPASVQLMRLGAFGSAPLMPSLAVDLRVLEFTRTLFLAISPNNTAISQALETFLSAMGYQLDNRNSLRRRFANALMWYTHLKNLLKSHYEVAIETARETLLSDERGNSPQTPRGRRRERSAARSPSLSQTTVHRRRSSTPPASRSATPTPAPNRKRRREPTPETVPIPFPEPPPLSRPSQYLIRKCPACFANLIHDPSQVADGMVCIDACFTQKGQNGEATDPNKRHPDTNFISEELATLTEEYVDSLRNAGKRKEKRQKAAAKLNGGEDDDDDDCCEAQMRLPRSVLDGCESSFKAADERRQKASTARYRDTGLMALVCRHDRPLFVVNMHSAGEKQFYVVALLETLFQHLPADIRVGVLYDVVCTFERSCWKWGFLSRFMNRLAFAVSVFHAFGHEWPCQLLYHPRKRDGFGFTNGEGCERFWKSLRHLIAQLRIRGYHQRLYTLDVQIQHNLDKSLFTIAEWIRRTYYHISQKRREAAQALLESGHTEELLTEQWHAQVAYQTKPLPRRHRNRGLQAVNAVVLLRSAVKTREGEVKELRRNFLAATARDDPDAAACESEYKAAEAELVKAKEKLKRKHDALGVTGRTALQQLAKSDAVSVRVNAQALMFRIRENLRRRKFELDPVERAHRRRANDAKLHAHTSSAVKRRAPAISKMVGEYNKLCKRLAQLIRDGKAPRGSAYPIEINLKGLWKLDVDDAIFQNVGLDDADEGGNPPLWMSDESVRSGIRAMLELKRCDEEEARLKKEALALRVWFGEEWKVINKAMCDTESDVDKYHLQLHKDRLFALCATWDKALPDMGEGAEARPSWGIEPTELSAYYADSHRSARGEDRNYGAEDDGDDEGSEDEDADDQLDILELEAIARVEAHDEDTN